MIFKCVNFSAIDPATVISLRCPSCRQRGTFETIKVSDLQNNTGEGLNIKDQIFYIHGQRRCPNPECKAHIFFVYAANQKQLLLTFPPEFIDFDATDLPTPVLKSLEEAITCHANRCFIAAAIMMRKTLEELCRDRGAMGNNLKDRIKQLGAKVILPQELLDSLDDLRLLGNDAAHIESQHYDKIGQEEIEISIEVTKEVLKAVYQYNSLMKKLKMFKKSPTPTP